MLSTISSLANNNFLGKIYKDLLGYFNIYEFLKLKITAGIKSKIIINSVPEFWARVLSDSFIISDYTEEAPLKDGQIIELHDMFLSDFAPKLPGQIWTKEGMNKFILGNQKTEGYKTLKDEVYLVLDPLGKKQVLEAGLGSIRINPSINNDDNFMYMSLTSLDIWKVDFGIPIIVSKQVYKEFLKYSENGGVYVNKLEGLLNLNYNLPIKNLITPALGVKIPEELDIQLKSSCFLPKCFIYVNSPLNVSFKYHSNQPDCVAWTMFETNSKIDKYKFSYTEFNPNDNESIHRAVDFLNFYVQNNNGKKIITDFDGMIPKLNSTIPLDTNPIVSNKAEIKEILNNLSSWTK